MKLNTMKVRHILRHEQSRQSFSGCSVCVVCGDYPDHLWASVCTEDDRSAAYAVYCYAVHEVGVSAVQVRADGSSEEAGKKWRCDVGESDPRNVRSDIDSSLSWEEWKRLLEYRIHANKSSRCSYCNAHGRRNGFPLFVQCR